jgi:hypothetical protein
LLKEAYGKEVLPRSIALQWFNEFEGQKPVKKLGGLGAPSTAVLFIDVERFTCT